MSHPSLTRSLIVDALVIHSSPSKTEPTAQKEGRGGGSGSPNDSVVQIPVHSPAVAVLHALGSDRIAQPPVGQAGQSGRPVLGLSIGAKLLSEQSTGKPAVGQ